MSIQFAQLRNAVANAGQSDALQLSADRDKVATKAPERFGGRAVAWLKGLSSSNQIQDTRANIQVRGEVYACLRETFHLNGGMDLHLFDKVSAKVDWASTQPLSARQVSEIIDDLQSARKTGPYVDACLEGPTKVLGSGAANTVHLGEWRVDPHTTQKMVFKGEPPPGTALQLEAGEIGISEQGPNLAARNVVTYQLSQALQLNVIPETHFAHHNQQDGSVMALAPGSSPQGDGSLRVHTGATTAQIEEKRDSLDAHLATHDLRIKEVGKDGSLTLERIAPTQAEVKALISYYDLYNGPDEYMTEEQARALAATKNNISATQWMEKVDNLGKAAIEIDVADPGLRRGINDLQWLDCLCGQADRHPGNIFVEYDPNGRVSGVKGIDNDMSFGVNTTLDHANATSPIGRAQAKHPAVPQVIDKGLRDRLVAMAALPANHPNSLETLIGGKLSAAEVAQARVRLDEMVLRLNSGTIEVISDPAEWGSSKVANMMEVGATGAADRADRATGSYLEACQSNQQGLQDVRLVKMTTLQESVRLALM